LVTAAIIDDDQDAVGVFAEYLEVLDIKVVSVGHDGKAAVDIYKKYKPDIVFLDLMMPKYDGAYALSEIRNLDPNAKVVILTAYLDSTNSKKLELLKPTEIFIKPFDMEKIKGAVEKITQKLDHTIFSEEKKALVSITISQTLLKMSPSATNEVGRRLYTKYRCYFSDCLEHPEYLNDVLTEIFGNGAKVVTNAIRQSLAEFEDQYPISNFLAVLSK
jgi:two-component system chemotaxis response regulator CheY